MTIKLKNNFETGSSASDSLRLYENENSQEDVEMEMDNEDEITSSSSEIMQILEAKDGLKLVKYVVAYYKEVCKILYSTEHSEFTKKISSKINETCLKYSKNSAKASKFTSKVLSQTSELSCDSEWFKKCLKNGLKYPENSQGGSQIIKIVQSIFSVGASLGQLLSPTLGIQMIVSHSKAADIFLESHNFLKKPNTQSTHSTVLEKSVQSKLEQQQENEEKYSEIKTQLLKLWKNLVTGFTKISKTDGTPNDKKILENSIPYLLQMYGATMSESDQTILEILQLYSSNKLQLPIDQMPVFGPKCFDPVPPRASNPLYAHSSKANTILNLVNPVQAFKTALEYSESNVANAGHYDVRFLLPLLCHTLDAKNICESIRVVTNGWIYMIMRGLSFENDTLRNLSFLAFKLLIQNFQLPKKGFKTQDIKVWLHFLLSIRCGLKSLGTCKISNLLSVWIVCVWEAIREPGHPMYQRVTTLLLAKPTIDLTVLPDFLPFYNAIDGNKETRVWIIKVLTYGLKTKDDWKVAQRNPTINSLCCSFSLESVFVQRDILKILQTGAEIPEVAEEMINKHAILIWITNVPVTNKLYRRELHKFFRTLEQNCSESESKRFLFQFVSRKHGWTDITYNTTIECDEPV